MRQRARQSVDLRHHQGVATLYRSYRVRELRPGAEPARGFLLIDGFTTRRRQGIALTAQILVFCRDAGISDEGHTPLRRPIDFLTPVEVAALLAAPDLNTLCGRPRSGKNIIGSSLFEVARLAGNHGTRLRPPYPGTFPGAVSGFG